MSANPDLPPATTLERAAWCAFDFANSSFTTIMVTVVYPPYFVTLASTQQRGEIGWAWALGASQLVALVLSPVIGALADQRARKKLYLGGSWLVCLLGCGVLSFVGEGAVAAAWVVFVLANIGFSLGENLIAAFLPELAPRHQMGRLSGIGWAVGYFGGLASLWVAWHLLEGDRAALVPLATGAFFLIAGLPTFLFLRERAHPRGATERSAVTDAVARLRRTFSERKSLPDLFRLLIALCLEQAGVVIVVGFAAVYARAEFQLSGAETAQLFIGLQIAAAAGAALFGFVQDKVGGKRALIGTVLVWLLAVLVTLLAERMVVFCIGAALAGVAMGSSQASGRAMIGTFTPKDRQGEWFGLWGISMRTAGVMGVAAYALVRGAGSTRAAMWSTAVFFILSLCVLATVDEKRGIAAADAKEAST